MAGRGRFGVAQQRRVVVSLSVGFREGFPLISGGVGGAGCLLPSQHRSTRAPGDLSGVLGGRAFGDSAVPVPCCHRGVMYPVDQRVYGLTGRAAGVNMTRSLPMVMRQTDTRRIGQALRPRILCDFFRCAGAAGRSDRMRRRLAEQLRSICGVASIRSSNGSLERLEHIVVMDSISNHVLRRARNGCRRSPARLHRTQRTTVLAGTAAVRAATTQTHQSQRHNHNPTTNHDRHSHSHVPFGQQMLSLPNKTCSRSQFSTLQEIGAHSKAASPHMVWAGQVAVSISVYSA